MAVIDYVCSIGKHFLGDSAQKYNKRELFVEGMNHIHLQERALLYRMLEGTDKVPGLRHMSHNRVHIHPPTSPVNTHCPRCGHLYLLPR